MFAFATTAHHIACVARAFVAGFLVVVVVFVVVAAIFDIVLGGFNSKEHYGMGSFESRGVFDEKARAIVAFHVRFW